VASYVLDADSPIVADITTALQRPQALDSATSAGLGRATPHASPR